MTIPERKRVFILGAGFSKAAGMPDACELTESLLNADRMTRLEEFQSWARGLLERVQHVNKLDGLDQPVNYEQLFDYAAFDRELWKMKQHESPLHRTAPNAPSQTAKSIECWLADLEKELVTVVISKQESTERPAISPVVSSLRDQDEVLTFNYDTLVEECLKDNNRPWSHGFPIEPGVGVKVLKLHGSIDWWLTPTIPKKKNDFERLFGWTPPAQWDDLDLLCEAREELGDAGFDLRRAKGLDKALELNQEYKTASSISPCLLPGVPHHRPGLAGLGAHKPLHGLVGSGAVWRNAFKALKEADKIYVIGWSASPYDTMARFHFASVLAMREKPLERVVVVDPRVHDQINNYRAIFENQIIAVPYCVQEADWPALLAM